MWAKILIAEFAILLIVLPLLTWRFATVKWRTEPHLRALRLLGLGSAWLALPQLLLMLLVLIYPEPVLALLASFNRISPASWPGTSLVLPGLLVCYIATLAYYTWRWLFFGWPGAGRLRALGLMTLISGWLFSPLLLFVVILTHW